MTKRFPIYLIVSALLSMFSTACNDDSDNDNTGLVDNSGYSAMVSSFSLLPNDSILHNLDSVFFSIDLDRAMIFNADSLPKGTKVNRLQLNIGLPSVSTAEITMPTDRGNDTIVDFLKNSTDSINFSRGSVKLRIVSANKEVERTYTIFVNVHNMNPDSLTWSKTAWTTLPSTLSSPTVQRTVEYQGKAVCFTAEGSSYCRAVCDNPADNNWQKQAVTLPAGAVIESITATSDRLYMLADGNTLYQSSDMGSSWTSTGTVMHHIYGGFDTLITGVRAYGNSFRFVTYPETTESDVPAECPVSATSPSLVFTNEWSESPMLIITGGITAAGTVTGSTWAFDGSAWARISQAPIPDISGMVLVPYFAFKTSAYWRVTKQTVLLAFGGRTASGELSRAVYISYDRGVHWAYAPQLLQLPNDIVPGAGAQALVFDETISSRATTGWHSGMNHTLPSWYAIMPEAGSRAIKPITQWDCPYIYLFGGTDTQSGLNRKVWRGAINRLVFKPLQ